MSYNPPKEPRPTPPTDKSLDSISWKLKDISETLKRIAVALESMGVPKSGSLF